MRNIFIVLKHEVLTTLSKTSFWVMTFLFPAVVILLTLGGQVIIQKNVTEKVEAESTSQSTDSMQYSYVDLSGIIQNIPEGITAGTLNPYPDLDAAQNDLEAGKIEWYAIISADYLETGDLVVVQHSFNPMTDVPTSFFQYLLVYNLAPDPRIAPVLASQNPSTVMHDIAPDTASQGRADGMAGTLVSYGTLFIFFMLISMSSGLMLNSVSKEKSNLVAEVLLLSLRPRELMAGKLLGLSLVALFQMITWVGGILLFLDQGKNMIAGLAQINLPDSFLLWAVLFFILGFL
ncbi:MAG: ABC transporter permease, partial [Chloroflexi bacterium]